MYHECMKKILLIAVLGVVALAGFFLVRLNQTKEQGVATANYKDAEYSIEGERVRLGNGGTQYFGNELKTDLNDDGREDVVFLLTRQTGGTGTFFYAVAALNAESGYIGSDGYFLGDRIAPQTTELSRNPRHVHVVVVNYAERAAGEPMTARASVGVSAYLKLSTSTMQWGIVEPDFEGESR